MLAAAPGGPVQTDRLPVSHPMPGRHIGSQGSTSPRTGKRTGWTKGNRKTEAGAGGRRGRTHRNSQHNSAQQREAGVGVKGSDSSTAPSRAPRLRSEEAAPLLTPTDSSPRLGDGPGSQAQQTLQPKQCCFSTFIIKTLIYGYSLGFFLSLKMKISFF